MSPRAVIDKPEHCDTNMKTQTPKHARARARARARAHAHAHAHAHANTDTHPRACTHIQIRYIVPVAGSF